jgi:hypothetical protein
MVACASYAPGGRWPSGSSKRRVLNLSTRPAWPNHLRFERPNDRLGERIVEGIPTTPDGQLDHSSGKTLRVANGQIECHANGRVAKARITGSSSGTARLRRSAQKSRPRVVDYQGCSATNRSIPERVGMMLERIGSFAAEITT